jgi:copper chaperone CopZ
MMTSTTYQVTGMTCGHCARAVTDELESVPGVSAVTVTLVPGGESAVTITSAAPLEAKAVSAALDEAGAYRLSGNAGDAGSGAADLAAAGSAAAPSSARTLPLI